MFFAFEHLVKKFQNWKCLRKKKIDLVCKWINRNAVWLQWHI